jgi:hypothetical protein
MATKISDQITTITGNVGPLDADQHDANWNALIAFLENLLTGHNHDGDTSREILDASTTQAGKVTLATSAQALTGTDPTKAIAAAALKYVLDQRVVPQNLLGNSPFGAWSNATLENVGSAIYSDTDGSSYASWAGTNCNVTDGGANLLATLTSTTGYANYPCSGLTVGKLYKATIVVANGTGTWGTGDALRAFNNALSSQLAVTPITGPGTYTVVWRATETNNRILPSMIGTHTDGHNFALTSITLYEVTPGCIAADVKAPDGMSKTATLDLYRDYGSATYYRGLYGIKAVKGADSAEYLNLSSRTDEPWYKKYRGRTVTLGCYVYPVSDSSNVKLQINDSDGTTESAYVASDSKTWVEVTRTVGASITSFTPRVLFDGSTSGVAYISEPTLVFGASIGEGNYQPRPDEIIWTETPIALSSLDGKTSLSTTSATAIDIGADTSGLIEKGAKAVFVSMEASDSGSAGGDCKATLGPSSTNQPFACSPAGLANSRTARAQGWVPLAADGTLTYVLTATGSATLAIPKAKITGIQY